MKRTRCFAAVFCLLLLLAGCAGEPKVKQTFEGDLASYAEMTDGTWTCDGRSYAYRLEIRGRLHSAASDSVFVYPSNVPEISFERAAKAAGLSSNSDDYFAPEEAVLVEWNRASGRKSPSAYTCRGALPSQERMPVDCRNRISIMTGAM